MMAHLDRYRDAYEFIKLDRDERGVLTMRLHYQGGRFLWGFRQHDEVADCLLQISRDRGNRLVILTGTSDVFLDEFEPVEDPTVMFQPSLAEVCSAQMSTGHRLITNHLDIEVPMIGVVNGPATWHAELPLLCDIVLCADDACFQDYPHFPNGIVPGDGIHVLWPLLLGANRGRYFLMMGQKIAADEALRLGLVGEVMPREDLAARAQAIAADLVSRDDVFLRHTRFVLVQKLRKEFADLLPLGLHASFGAALAGASLSLGGGKP